MILEVTRHGWDFAKDDELNKLSDLENHRLGLHFTLKDEKKIVGFVSVCRNYNKKRCQETSDWLKCPDVYLGDDFSYYKDNGFSYIFHMPYSEQYKFGWRVRPAELYIATKKGLLDLVNSVSKDTYTDIKIHSEEDSYKIFNEWCKWGGEK